ncbi:MAG: hypothetical protein JWM68_3345 [Verrucomicrobiales bacterium]|nr:hypothetical protein [Verrucomicrobiales bacterium]
MKKRVLLICALGWITQGVVAQPVGTVKLTGFLKFGGATNALFEIAKKPSEPPETITLLEGETTDGIEVVKINCDSGQVDIILRGKKKTLGFDHPPTGPTLLHFEQMSCRQAVDVYRKLSDGNMLWILPETKRLSLHLDAPSSKTHALKSIEQALLEQGYTNTVIGKDCFVFGPIRNLQQLKSFVAWPKIQDGEKADIFFNFDGALVVQVFIEYASLIDRSREETKDVCCEGVYLHTGRFLTKPEAIFVLEIAFALHGYKPELVGEKSVTLVPLEAK